MQSNRWKAISLATLYSLSSMALTLTASYHEGTLIDKKIYGNGVVQFPYSNNLSTIIDFSILNPLFIYISIKIRDSYDVFFEKFNIHHTRNIYSVILNFVISSVIGTSAMYFYFSGFIGGNFYTESFFPDGNYGASISITGYIIFAYTSIILSVIIYSFFEFMTYVQFLFRVSDENIKFRLPPAISDDISIAAKPCIYASTGVVILFFMIIVFIFRDFFQYDFRIEQSNRIFLLVPYLMICCLVVMPLMHLHRIMKKQKENFILCSDKKIEKMMGFNDKNNPWRGYVGDRLINEIDKIHGIRKLYSAIPVWPIDGSTLIPFNFSAIFSAAALLYKVFKDSPLIG